jgi:hypothetical protein
MAHWTDGLELEPRDPVDLLRRLRAFAVGDNDHQQAIDGAVDEAVRAVDGLMTERRVELGSTDSDLLSFDDPMLLAYEYVWQVLKAKGRPDPAAAAATASVRPRDHVAGDAKAARDRALDVAYATILAAVRSR